MAISRKGINMEQTKTKTLQKLAEFFNKKKRGVCLAFGIIYIKLFTHNTFAIDGISCGFITLLMGICDDD